MLSTRYSADLRETRGANSIAFELQRVATEFHVTIENLDLNRKFFQCICIYQICRTPCVAIADRDLEIAIRSQYKHRGTPRVETWWKRKRRKKEDRGEFHTHLLPNELFAQSGSEIHDFQFGCLQNAVLGELDVRFPLITLHRHVLQIPEERGNAILPWGQRDNMISFEFPWILWTSSRDEFSLYYFLSFWNFRISLFITSCTLLAVFFIIFTPLYRYNFYCIRLTVTWKIINICKNRRIQRKNQI